MTPEPLIQDEYAGFPLKRSLDRILEKRKLGVRGVGVYCAYAPVELIRAAGAVPITLCAYSNKTVSDAERVLPSSICPLIKSSFGFITTNTCPFFELSDAVVAETTCDGKKKMFELISSIKPMHVMDLPQIPDAEDAQAHWAGMIRRLRTFLEKELNADITDEAVERHIADTNRKNSLMEEFFGFAALRPPALSWQEMYDVIAVAQVSSEQELRVFLEPVLRKLALRVSQGTGFGTPDAPRVLVTGCPINGDSAKVLRIIDETGGVVVALEGCSGMKTFMTRIDEGSSDPVDALARAYLTIPCSCMTPNARRLSLIDALIDRFRPNAVVDVILQGCHAYNIESYKVEQHIKQRHHLPFLKVETDYSTGDVERIRMRVEAILEGTRR